MMLMEEQKRRWLIFISSSSCRGQGLGRYTGGKRVKLFLIIAVAIEEVRVCQPLSHSNCMARQSLSSGLVASLLGI